MSEINDLRAALLDTIDLVADTAIQTAILMERTSHLYGGKIQELRGTAETLSLRAHKIRVAADKFRQDMDQSAKG